MWDPFFRSKYVAYAHAHISSDTYIRSHAWLPDDRVSALCGISSYKQQPFCTALIIATTVLVETQSLWATHCISTRPRVVDLGLVGIVFSFEKRLRHSKDSCLQYMFGLNAHAASMFQAAATSCLRRI